jgi:hypothetical protein
MCYSKYVIVPSQLATAFWTKRWEVDRLSTQGPVWRDLKR